MFTSITPTEPVPLFGRGDPERISSHVATGLEANLIALPTAQGLFLLIGIDTLFASTAFRTAVLSQLAPSVRERIDDMTFVASHTHNAPALDPTKPALGLVTEPYFAAASATVADLISRSVVANQPAVANFRQATDACHLNAIRRRRGLRIDRQFPFLTMATNMVPRHGADVPRTTHLAVAFGDDGAPAWAIWSWCCHATASPDPYAICADFPGRVRAHIRERLGAPGLPVVFLPGFSGDVRADPSYLPLEPRALIQRPLQRSFASQTPANFDKLCGALAASVDRMLNALEPSGLSRQAAAGNGTVVLGDLLDGCNQKTAGEEVGIKSLALGDFGLLLIGAEVCSPYIPLLAPKMPTGWLLSGYSDQVFGYLPSDAQIREGGYESEGFRASFALQGRFRPHIESYVIAAAETAIRRSLGGRPAP